MLLLLTILNFQARTHLTTDILITLSLSIDLVLIFLLTHYFASAAMLLIIIPLMDTFEDLRQNFLGVLLLLSGFFGFLIYQYWDHNSLIYLLTYVISIVVFITIKAQQTEIANLQFLYDEVRRNSYQLELAQSQIEQYTQEVRQLSQIRERNRIAEKLHDTIGHALTSLLMQLEASKILIAQDPTAAIASINQATDTLRHNIKELRDTVKNLEVTSYKNFRTSLNQLIAEFQKNVSIPITFELIGTPAEIHPEKETVLYNNTREALTNIARHSNASSAKITLQYAEKMIVLTIQDNGSSKSPVQKGYGMRAMQTRTELVGGSMHISNEAGFLLEFEIPILEEMR